MAGFRISAMEKKSSNKSSKNVCSSDAEQTTKQKKKNLQIWPKY